MKLNFAQFAVFAGLSLSALAFTWQSPGAPTVGATLVSKKIAPGATVRAVLTVTIPEGFHAYQNPPMRDYEIPLNIESETKGFAIKPTYPAGAEIDFAGAKTMAYEGKMEIPFTFAAPKKAGSYSLKVKVNYQFCNDSNCWPPASISIDVPYVVLAPQPPAEKKPIAAATSKRCSKGHLNSSGRKFCKTCGAKL